MQGRVPEKKNVTEKKWGRISCRVNYTVELTAALLCHLFLVFFFFICSYFLLNGEKIQKSQRLHVVAMNVAPLS